MVNTKRKILIIATFTIFFLLTLFLIYKNNTQKVNIYLFKGEGCPHCAQELADLEEILSTSNYKNKANLIEYEVWYNEENKDLLEKVENKLNIEIKGVPFTIIGDKYFSGYSSSMKDSIKKYIDNAYKNKKDILKDIGE